MTTNNELIYSDFKSTKKTPIFLQPIFGSMVALTHLNPDFPKNSIITQKSTLPLITNDDVNTVFVEKQKKQKNELPILSNMYIASLTVVGLFILFRFIQKHP
jgi:hypothetical protein